MKLPYLYTIPVALGLAAIAMPALATPTTEELVLSDGVTTVTCTNTSLPSGCTYSAGVLSYIGAIGTYYAINITTGLGYPTYGAPVMPELHLNSVDFAGSGVAPGDLTILFSENGFTTGGGTATVGVGGVNGGTTTLSDYYDPGNGLGVTTTSCFSYSTATVGAFSATGSCAIPALSGFSITKFADLTIPTGKITSFDNQINVPEPAGLALIGLGLLALGLTRRKLG